MLQTIKQKEKSVTSFQEGNVTGGDVHVYSESEKGYSFKIYFPWRQKNRRRRSK